MKKLADLIQKGLNYMNTEQLLNEIINDNHTESKEYETQGFRDAAKSGGSPEAFRNSIDHFYSSILLKQKENEEEINRRNFEIENEIKEIQQKKSVKENELKRIKEIDLPEAEKDLRAAESKLTEFFRNPKDFVREEKDSFMQWVYGLTALFLMIFLYFFYTSVIYSALFRDVTISKFTIYNSIFYPKALEEALEKGFAAFMITVFSPFIFYGLGIALDNVKRKSSGKDLKKKITFVSILVFAFLLDALFAYHISERIYNSKAINTYENLEPYTLSHAIGDLNFWIIIALGFCVYLLFGYVFSLYNELRTNSSLYEKVRRQLEAIKIQAQEKVNSLKRLISDLQNEIKQFDLKIAELKKDYNKIIYSPIEIKNILSLYTRGWINFLKGGNYPEYQIKTVVEDLNNFYSKIGVSEK